MINLYTAANISVSDSEGGRINMCQAIKDIKEEGRAEGADMLAKLLKALEPGSEEYEKALNSSEERQKLYKKYNIVN